MRRIAIIFLLALMVSAGAWAQAGAGSAAVTGVVLEVGGDGIPDAIVTLSNTGLGFRRVINTSDDGVFDAPSLVPASGYQVKITRKGFVDWDSGQLTLSLGQTMEFHITLKHTAGYQGDESKLPKPRVEETQSGLGTLVTARDVDALPSPDRRLDSLVLADPLAGTDHRTSGTMLAGRPNSLFFTDGVATTNTYYPFQPVLARQLSQEAVQEFQVLSENYLALFGPSSGGVVNAVTRHGTNEYHGSGYEYFRNGSMAAKDRFALGNNLFNHQNQAGATVGGPILHNRIFFFGNFEALNGKGQGLNRISSPLLDDYTGQAFAPSNCKAPATAAQCTNAINFLQKQMNVLVPLTDSWLSGLGKVDYRRSERNTFSATASAYNAKAPNGGSVYDQIAANGGLLGLSNTSNDVRYGKASWTSTPTRLTVNEMRLGIFDEQYSAPAFTPGLSTGTLGINLEGVTVGNAHPTATSLGERRYQITDNFTLTTNGHSINVGGELWQTRDAVTSLAPAQYTYDTLTAFAQDFTGGGKNYTMFNQQVGAGARSLPMKQYNAYAFDTWRPFPRITIVGGVRFEKPRITQPVKANASYYQTGVIASPNINFAPRLSIAYRASDKTVLRAGYGWFFEPMPGALFDALYYAGNALNMADITAAPNMTNSPSFPRAYTAITGLPSGMTDLVFATKKLRNPYVRNLTLGLERRLDGNTTLSLNLVHNRGFKLYSGSDVNMKQPNASGTAVSKVYAIDNAAGQQVGTYYTDMYAARNDTRYNRIWQAENGGSWWYNAAILELRRRLAHGLNVQASYTLSSNTEDTAGPLLFGVLPIDTYNGNVGGDRGVSPLNQRHRGALSWNWQPEQRWLKGWTISGIAALASGQNETPLVMVQGQQFSGFTMPYANTLDGWGGWNRVPFQNIGSLSLGPQYSTNARISRAFAIRERVRASVMFDVFNVLNNQYTTGVNTYAYIATPTTPPTGAINGPFSGVLKPAPGVGTANSSAPGRMAQIGVRLTF